MHIEVRAASTHDILTPEALQFIATLELECRTPLKDLLQKRICRQQEIDAGLFPDFLNDTKIRANIWQIAPVPKDLIQRKVEITGPTERKMIINALNSGADCFMADFEDSNSPTWHNMIHGQINLQDAINRSISFINDNGKHYTLNDNIATLFVRPRGLHLKEKHLFVDGEPISASIFDFGLFFWNNTRKLLDNDSGPYFYLPKLQNHHEAQWWNNVFEMAQDMLGIPRSTIKATVLIEHILAAFETEEILFALKDHSAGLNCGRWDYLFSIIKTFRNHPEFVLPDRNQITMSSPFMEAYCKEVIRACHKRGAHAMGGMAAQIPIKNNPQANEAALEKVRKDKEREVRQFHDGTWVAHPSLVPIAQKAFASVNQNQLHRQLLERPTDSQLLTIPAGEITEHGIESNVLVGLNYIRAWLDGNGCVPINNLMEDLATFEISRCQLWQWIHHHIKTNTGNTLSIDRFEQILNKTANSLTETAKLNEAQKLFFELTNSKELKDFTSCEAYPLLE